MRKDDLANPAVISALEMVAQAFWVTTLGEEEVQSGLNGLAVILRTATAALGVEEV
jgi:hypothetical protein